MTLAALRARSSGDEQAELRAQAAEAVARVATALKETSAPRVSERIARGNDNPAWPVGLGRPLRLHAVDLAALEDQLVGWGLAVVVDQARAAGAEVAYVQHPPPAGTPAPDAWLLSLPWAGDAWRLREFCGAAGVALDRRQRTGAPPLILGGHGVINPYPLLDVADAVFVGEADDQAMALVRALEFGPDALREVPGVVIERDEPVEFQVARDLRHRQVHDAGMGRKGVGATRYLEIAKGCRGACRFCELGWLYGYAERPEREVDTALAVDPKVVLSAPDTDRVSYLPAMIRSGAYLPRWRSTRVAAYLAQEQAPRDTRRKRIRFGVEGMTKRLRTLAGKPISAGQLEGALSKGAAEGYSSGRVFLIGGLPTERLGDRMRLAALLDLIRSSGPPHTDIKVTGLSPQPLTPWQRLGIRGSLDACATYRAWRRPRASDHRWRLLLVDTHTTEADLVKHMRHGELVRYLGERGSLRSVPSDKRWRFVRSWAQQAGISYDRLLEPWEGELPWSGVAHRDAHKLATGERAWVRLMANGVADGEV